MDEGFFILIDKLDWIFQCDDMFLSIAIYMLEHGGHSRRLTTSRWSCDEDDSFFCDGEIEEVLRKSD